MTKVLIVEVAPYLGGSLTSIELVIRRGLQQGIEFGLMSSIDTGDVLPPEVQHYDLPLLSQKRASKSDYAKHILRQERAVFRCVRENQYDILLLNNMFEPNLPAALAGILLRRPIIQFVRDYERNSRSIRFLGKQVETFVAVSRSIQEHLLSIGIPNNKIALASEGIATKPAKTQEDQEQLRQKLEIPKDAHVIGFVGRIEDWKGYDLFIRAAIQVAKKDPKLHAFLIGGIEKGEEELVAQLQKEIADSGLTERIKMLGSVAPHEVAPFMRGIDALVHTSNQAEPFGRVLIEAMAVGTPVISSSEGGPREIVIDGKTGRLTPSEDLEALTQAIEWLYESSERPQLLGEQARKHVQVTYNEEVCATPVLNLIHSLSVHKKNNSWLG